MSDSLILSILSLLLAAAALSYSFYLQTRYRQLQCDLLRTRLLARLTDCSVLIGQILQDMERYDDFHQIAFGENPQDAPDLAKTLLKINGLRDSFSDFSQQTSIEKLDEATSHIEKVHDLMKSIAAKSPGLGRR